MIKPLPLEPARPRGAPQGHGQGKIIKAAEHGQLLRAKEVLAQAEREAQRIVADAEEVRAEAKRQGYRDGLQEGQRQAAAQMLETVAGAVDYLAGLEHQLAGVVLTAVEKIVRGFDDETLALAAVGNALKLLGQGQRIKLKASPQTAARLAERLPAEFPKANFVAVIPDPQLGDGDCVLESEVGIVNASVDCQLEAIRRFIDDKLGGEGRPTRYAAESFGA